MALSLDTAYAHHQAGRAAEAEAGYRQVLALQPENGDALYLLGVLCLQTRRAAEAKDLLERAVRRQGKNPHVRASLGTALLETGNADAAIRELRRALDLDPRHADALHNLGNALAAQGKLGEARRFYERLVGLRPDHAGAMNNVALCLIAERRYDAAVEMLRRAVAIAPAYRAARDNLGLALMQAGRYAEAATVLREAVRLAPDDPLAHALVAASLERDGALDEAAAHCRTALALQPEMIEALVNLGNVERRRERLAEAAALYQRALAQRPDYVPALENLGNALVALGRGDEAIAVYERALAADAANADIHANLAHALERAGRPVEAIARADAALAIDPDHADARMARALSCLALGRWGEGFRDYRARAAVAAIAPTLERAPLPADLAGRHVRIVRDQGLGDELFFLRFARALRDRGARVTYVGDPRLAAMIARAGIVDAVATPDAAPPADHVVAVGDLPWLLGMGDGDPPPPSIALAPLADRDVAVRARLEALGPPPYLGLTWRAGTAGRDRVLYKDVPPDRLGRALRAAPGTLISLQRLPGAGETEAVAAAAGRAVHDLSAANDDLEDMLALVGALDRYVAVSNTNVHLRAARGRACDVLVPFPAEFRWMAEGAASPWFPGCRLYRQRPRDGWDAALAALADGLGH